MTHNNRDFYAGIMHALITIHGFDQPVIAAEILKGLSESELRGLIRDAKKNEEYELSGLAEYEAGKKEQAIK